MLAEQPDTINKSDVIRYMAHLSRRHMAEISRRIQVEMALTEDTQDRDGREYDIGEAKP